LKGKFYHMCCRAHILDLIVEDGLKITEGSIEEIRDSVAYWRVSPKREETFKKACDSLIVAFSKKFKLECKMRWNSAYLMLQMTSLYEEVFPTFAKRKVTRNAYLMMASGTKLEIFVKSWRLSLT